MRDNQVRRIVAKRRETARHDDSPAFSHILFDFDPSATNREPNLHQ
jgi:hypothetical protein